LFGELWSINEKLFFTVFCAAGVVIRNLDQRFNIDNGKYANELTLPISLSLSLSISLSFSLSLSFHQNCVKKQTLSGHISPSLSLSLFKNEKSISP
jgi:hypothetical protein